MAFLLSFLLYSPQYFLICEFCVFLFRLTFRSLFHVQEGRGFPYLRICRSRFAVRFFLFPVVPASPSLTLYVWVKRITSAQQPQYMVHPALGLRNPQRSPRALLLARLRNRAWDPYKSRHFQQFPAFGGPQLEMVDTKWYIFWPIPHFCRISRVLVFVLSGRFWRLDLYVLTVFYRNLASMFFLSFWWPYAPLLQPKSPPFLLLITITVALLQSKGPYSIIRQCNRLHRFVLHLCLFRQR